MLEDLFVRQFISSVPYVYNQHFLTMRYHTFTTILLDVLGWTCCSFSCDGYRYDTFDNQGMYVLFIIYNVTPPPYVRLLTLLQGCHQQSVDEKYYDRLVNTISY
jgi:hypothetical protein